MPGYAGLGDQVRVTTDHIDRLVFEFAMDHGACGDLMYRAIPNRLHVDQPCGLSWHSERQAIEGRRYRQRGRDLILDGWHGDSSRMYPIGEIPRRASA